MQQIDDFFHSQKESLYNLKENLDASSLESQENAIHTEGYFQSDVQFGGEKTNCQHRTYHDATRRQREKNHGTIKNLPSGSTRNFI